MHTCPSSFRRIDAGSALLIRLVSIISVLFCMATPLHAATIRVPADEPTVEAALAVAGPGDEILVAEAVYEISDGFTIATENLTLRSEVEHGAVFVLTQFPKQLLTIEASGFQFLDFGAYCPRIFEIDPGVEGTLLRNNQWFAISSLWPAFLDRGLNLHFENNRVHGFFGIGSTQGSGAVLRDNLFIFNGSPLFIDGEATLLHNRFERNSSFADDGSSGDGGAIRVTGSSPPGGIRILQNEFIFNVTDLSSHEAPGHGGAIFASGASGVEIVGNFFTRNQSRLGAALFAENSDLIIRDNIFYANSDSIIYEAEPERGLGGALRLENVSGEVANNTMVRNRAGLGGGAVSFKGPITPEFRSNLVVSNWTEGATIEAEDFAPQVWACNDVFGNESSVEFSGWPDPTGTDGNFSADPLFCDESSEDLTLSSDSPCHPNHSPPGCGLIGAAGVGCPVATVDGIPPSQELPSRGDFTFTLRISPNPATERVLIRSARTPFPSDLTGESWLRIVAVDGRLVRQWRLPADSASFPEDEGWEVQWDLRDLRGEPVRRGQYFVTAPGARGQLLVLD